MIHLNSYHYNWRVNIYVKGGKKEPTFRSSFFQKMFEEAQPISSLLITHTHTHTHTHAHAHIPLTEREREGELHITHFNVPFVKKCII